MDEQGFERKKQLVEQNEDIRFWLDLVKEENKTWSGRTYFRMAKYEKKQFKETKKQSKKKERKKETETNKQANTSIHPSIHYSIHQSINQSSKQAIKCLLHKLKRERAVKSLLPPPPQGKKKKKKEMSDFIDRQFKRSTDVTKLSQTHLEVAVQARSSTWQLHIHWKEGNEFW